jgi:hypothetical protein
MIFEDIYCGIRWISKEELAKEYPKMTTREEYAEAAVECAHAAKFAGVPHTKRSMELAARVLRQRAEGAVLCKKVKYEASPMDDDFVYVPIEEQP